MRGSSRSVRIAGTTEHAKVVVGGGCVVQCEVRSRVAHRLGGKTVYKVGGGVQGLCPVAGRERTPGREGIESYWWWCESCVRPGRFGQRCKGTRDATGRHE
jgi:hypothetical protein